MYTSILYIRLIAWKRYRRWPEYYLPLNYIPYFIFQRWKVAERNRARGKLRYLFYRRGSPHRCRSPTTIILQSKNLQNFLIKNSFLCSRNSGLILAVTAWQAVQWIFSNGIFIKPLLHCCWFVWLHDEKIKSVAFYVNMAVSVLTLP